MSADDERRPWWLWATGVACVAVVVFAWSAPDSQTRSGCSDAASFMTDAWRTPVRSRLQARDPDGVQRLDALAQMWIHERTEVCHGAQAGADTPARWSARRRCLERWAERFDAAVEQADAAAVTVGEVASVLLPPRIVSFCRPSRPSARGSHPACPGAVGTA